MTEQLNPSTPNNDVGLYWKTSRRVDPLAAGLPFKIGQLATGILAGLAGTVIWKNEEGSAEITQFEAGQWLPCATTEILVGATIDGVAETTTATNLFWTASPLNLGKE